MQLCGTEFRHVNQLSVQLTYTPSYNDCVGACVELDSTTDCVGLQYEINKPGPGGYLCYLLFSVAGPQDNQVADVVLGIRQPKSNSGTVFRSSSFLTLTIGKHMSGFIQTTLQLYLSVREFCL
jgi:hypothetical protein